MKNSKIMEGRIYPNWEQLEQQHQPLTNGEIALLRYLDKYLPQDKNWCANQSLADYNGWLVFAQPYLNGTRPDIIVFNPFVGVVIIEVKDWKLYHYSWESINKGTDIKDNLMVTDSNGSYKIKSPLTQVIHYKEIIIGQLVPMIGELIDKNNAAFALIKVAIYFHNETTKDAQNFFSKKVPNFKHFPIFGNDYLNDPKSIEKIIPEVIYKGSKYWDRAWNYELLFWFKPPLHSIEQGTPLKLRADQFKIAEPRAGHYRVRGVAGSGKTLSLAYRAAKLASQNKNVLVISYNITLWHYIKDMIARATFNFSWSSFTFNHFHGFCRDVLNNLGCDWPDSTFDFELEDNDLKASALQDFFRYTIPNTINEAIKSKKYKKFDAILIDEGQDFYIEWYSMLNKNFLNSNDELLVVVDKKQNIYQRELDWFDKRTRNSELEKFKTDILILTISYRLPPRIVAMANEFSEMFNLDQGLKVAREKINPQVIQYDHIVWIDIDEDKKFNWIYKAFDTLKKNGESASDIVILLPNHKIGLDCVRYFENKNVKVNHIFELGIEKWTHSHKKAFWMGDSRLKMSTIHSFKGWELMNVIIFLPLNSPESNLRLDAILYTALTRTRKNLVIFNAQLRYNEFGKRFPHRWDEQNNYLPIN